VTSQCRTGKWHLVVGGFHWVGQSIWVCNDFAAPLEWAASCDPHLFWTIQIAPKPPGEAITEFSRLARSPDYIAAACMRIEANSMSLAPTTRAISNIEE